MERTATPAEVCKALEITDRTLRDWRAKGCPATRDTQTGGRPGWRYSVDEVRAFRDEHQLGVPGCGARPDERPDPLPKAAAGAPPIEPAAPSPRAVAQQALLEARAEKERALADRQRAELERVRGQLVPLEDLRAFWEGQVAVVKAHVAALPGRLAPQLVEQPYEEIHQALERALDAMLEAFAAGELPGGPTAPPADPDAPTYLEGQPHGGALLRYEKK